MKKLNKTRQNTKQKFLSIWETFFKIFKRKENHRQVKTTPTPHPLMVSRTVLFNYTSKLYCTKL